MVIVCANSATLNWSRIDRQNSGYIKNQDNGHHGRSKVTIVLSEKKLVCQMIGFYISLCNFI